MSPLIALSLVVVFLPRPSYTSGSFLERIDSLDCGSASKCHSDWFRSSEWPHQRGFYCIETCARVKPDGESYCHLHHLWREWCLGWILWGLLRWCRIRGRSSHPHLWWVAFHEIWKSSTRLFGFSASHRSPWWRSDCHYYLIRSYAMMSSAYLLESS